jgi:nicotinamidase-related amidase
MMNNTRRTMGAALLLLDFQPAVLATLPDAGQAVAAAAQARAYAAEVGWPVFYTRVAFTQPDLDSIPLRSKAFAPVKGSGFLMDDDPSTAVVAELAPATGDTVLRKTRFGAFSTTGLAGHLRGRDVNTLYIAGVSTSGAVLSTVRDAGDQDFALVVLGDACADSDADVHRMLTEQVLPVQADVIATADIGARREAIEAES